MKFLINTSLLLVILIFYQNNAFPLSDYGIKDICRKEKRRTKCIKELKSKKLDLIKGKRIVIPVVPFKK